MHSRAPKSAVSTYPIGNALALRSDTGVNELPYRTRRQALGGQVDAVQRRDDERRARGGLPVHHHRPECRQAYVRVDCAAPEFGHSCTSNTGYCDDGVRFVPTKLVDVAGLVPGAREGRGLGN